MVGRLLICRARGRCSGSTLELLGHWEPNSAHAISAGILGSEEFGMRLRHDLVESSRPGCQVVGDPTKIVEAVVDAFGETDPRTWFLVS